MSEQMNFADGKYTVINENGLLTALRHGEPWQRDLTGDNLVYWMLVEALELKRQRDLMLDALNNIAAWNDGEVGGHMDEPGSAKVAREAIKAAAQ
jgi:hypothetical protein